MLVYLKLKGSLLLSLNCFEIAALIRVNLIVYPILRNEINLIRVNLIVYPILCYRCHTLTNEGEIISVY